MMKAKNFVSTVLLVTLVATGFLVLRYNNAKNSEERATRTGVFGEVGSFELIDQMGEKFTAEDLKGKVWVSNFIFTSCAAECPILNYRLAQVSTEMGNRDDLAFVSFSVDPQTDTPERLTEYAKQFEVNNWSLLTGDVLQLNELIRTQFLLPIAKDFEERQESMSAGLLHSNKFVVVDRQGRIRFYYDGFDEDSVEEITEMVTQLLDEPVIDKS